VSSKALDNLVRTGVLKEEPGNQKEFDGLVSSGRARLSDAKVKGLSPEGHFDLAYGAAHAFSLAALRWHGYRPKNQRFAVFQALEHTIGLKAQFWRVLAKCHSIRNLAEYAGEFEVDVQLIKDLILVTEMVQAAVEKLGPLGITKTF
jgi:hypothetical protein